MVKSSSQRTTLDDVARLANVSSQTVSRVVNNSPRVSDETRRRVQEAIRELGYRPNRAARSLATQRSSMLGIIGFGMDYYGPAQMIHNIERTARAKGYGVTLLNINAFSADVLRRAMEDLGDQTVDGLVFILPLEGICYGELQNICGDIPFVHIDAPLGVTVPSVVIDQYLGSQLVTQHLIDLGHETLCEISGPLTWNGARARHQAWLDTVAAAGLNAEFSLEGNWTAQSGYDAMCELLKIRRAFTGLVVGNDQMALGAIRALRTHGFSVPEHVSVVGFDDIPEATFYEPPLTTIRQDFGALGEQSVEYLTALINNPDTPVHQRVLYPQLIGRKSTRKIAESDLARD